MGEGKGYKFNRFRDSKRSNLEKYREIFLGDSSLFELFKFEIITTTISWMPGALGLFLRSKLYPFLFQDIGKNVFFGKDITFRHPNKIRIGSYVVIDDNCMIDAKGDNNNGIIIGDGVYIGRNTIIYCKDGDIIIEDNVNIASNCQIFSSNKLTICKDTVIGAYSYLLSGGEYDYRNTSSKFADQSGIESKCPSIIGSNCWLAARVTILDGVSVGDNSVIGAGAVVLNSIPENSLAVGIPARVIKTIQNR